MPNHKAMLLSCLIIDSLNKNNIPYFIEPDYSEFFEVETYTDEPLWFRFYDNELKVIKWNKEGNNSEDWKTYTYEELEEDECYEEIEDLIESQTINKESPVIDYKLRINVILEVVQVLSNNNISFETIGYTPGAHSFGRDTLGSVFSDKHNFWIDFFESGFSIYEKNPDKDNIEEYFDRRKNLTDFTYTDYLAYEPNPPYINQPQQRFYNTLMSFNKNEDNNNQLYNRR